MLIGFIEYYPAKGRANPKGTSKPSRHAPAQQGVRH
jgi:hypothetical protein